MPLIDSAREVEEEEEKGEKKKKKAGEMGGARR
jgi:hypothetical protein